MSNTSQYYKPSPQETIKCSVFEVINNKDTLGTGFLFEIDSKIYAVTAAHLLLAANRTSLYIRPACQRDLIPVKSFTKLPGIDASIIYPGKNVSAIGIISPNESPGYYSDIYGLAFPNLQIAEPRLKGVPIPTSGQLVESSGADILFTMNVVQHGSSGSPVVDSNSKLRGMLTNRVLVDGNFTGVAYGISEKTIRTAITTYYLSNNK